MDSLGFKKWLDEVKADKSTKYRGDLVCRAGRVERAFKLYDEDFLLDSEFEKDGGESLLHKFRHKGKGIETKPINLPVDSFQMNDFATAVRYYFSYLNAKKAK